MRYEGLYINQKGKGTNLLITGLLLKEIWWHQLVWSQWLKAQVCLHLDVLIKTRAPNKNLIRKIDQSSGHCPDF